MTHSIKHQRIGGPSGDSEKCGGETSDPLTDLFQVDDIDCTPMEKEALVLVTQLLQNVEEYYVLQGQIRDVMAQDRVLEDRIKGLMDRLLKGLLVEQTFLGKEFMGFSTL